MQAFNFSSCEQVIFGAYNISLIVELPQLFEEAIQISEVKKQDIQKALAELSKVEVELDTLIKSADFQKTVNIVK